MKLAFYKGTKAENPQAKLFDRAVCWWTFTAGRFSHCELVVSGPDNEAVCLSSSYRDGGVRQKVIDLTSGRWELVDIIGDKAVALNWFLKNDGKHYDVPGLFGFVLPFRMNMRHWWFCSEACAEALGLKRSWEIHPNKLYEIVMNPLSGMRAD
jgi:hypothetical protein